MSGYNSGRRGPSSHYIAGLNQIESDFTQDDYVFDDDLALFTNTEFIHNDILDFNDLDFDFTQSIPGEEDFLKTEAKQQHLLQQEQQQRHDNDPLAVAPKLAPLPAQHTPPQSSVSIPVKKQKISPRSATVTKRVNQTIASAASAPIPPQIQPLAAGSTNPSAAPKVVPSTPVTALVPSNDSNTSSLPQQSAQTADGTMNFEGADFHFADIGFTPQAAVANHNLPYGNAAANYDFNVAPQSPFDDKHQLNTPENTPPNGIVGVRPQGIMPDAAALLEASSRAAAEEDKRRRNTAASARFRFKKKQREQALEQSAKSMTDKLEKLEEKISQLEKENTWLRGLVVERTAKTSEEMTELYKTFKEETSKGSHKKGVGTLKAEN